MPVNGNVPVARSVLPDGIAGVDATVKKIVSMAHGVYGSKSAKVRALAIDIVRNAGIPDKDYYGEIVAVHNWVRDNIRYFHDPVGQETLSYPEETVFNSRGGDCLDENTRLLTPKGYIKIRDVRPGMVVQGRTGWTKVTEVWDKGGLPTKVYDLDNGGSFIATDDHRCLLLNGTEKRAGDLVAGDALLGPAAITLPEDRGELTPDDCYFIGVFIADGWADGNRVCIAGKDGFAKEAQKHWVEMYAKTKGWSTSWHSRYIRVYVPKDHTLGDFFYSGAVAPEKEIPEKLLAELTPEKAKRLLDGMLSDGYDPEDSKRTIGAELCRKPRGRGGACYSTTSDALALQARLLFRLNGVDVSDSLVVDHGGLGTHPVHRIYPRYYRSKPAKVEEITEAGVRRVWDIETADHGIYLPDADVVVHNCDDMVITEIALLGSIGVEAYPVVVGMFPGHYSHVYLHAKVPGGSGRNAGAVIPLDPIMKDWPAGREASQGIKAKKLYANLSNPLTMNGLPMKPLNKRLVGMRNGKVVAPVNGMDVGDLGAYAIAPSYLDREDSHADELCVPDGGSSLTAQHTVANGTQVDMPFEGIDGMFGEAVSDAGGAFSATSAGDAGTIVRSGGQLVPQGFIRNGPDLNEIMAMNPTTAEQLGPRGPIFARKAGMNKEYLPGSSDPKMASLARQLQSDPSVRASIIQTVGQKQYSLPSVQAALNAQQGLSPKPVRLNNKQTVVVLNSIPLDRLNATVEPLGSLGEQLAAAEAELARTLPAAQGAAAEAAKPQALYYAEGWRKASADLNSRAKALEQKILTLRQTLRDRGIADPTRSQIRAEAVTAGQHGLTGPVRTLSDRRVGAAPDQRLPRVTKQGLATTRNGPLDARGAQPMPMGSAMDTLKQPIVWGPALAFIGVLAFMYLKKRRAAAATA